MKETLSTILILGGGGFLAGHVARHYGQRGWRVIAVGNAAGRAQADIAHVWRLPHPDLAHLLATEQPDLVVNAAGRASVGASLVEPLADFEGSAVLTFRVLDDMRRTCPEAAFILLSSAAVYGEPEQLPVREDATIAPISPYGWHKAAAETVVLEHARQFGLRTASLRLFSAYGAGLRRQVVWDLTQRALKTPDVPLTLQGCPEDSRDFVHGSDVAAALDAVFQGGDLAGEAYNVAAGVETPIGALASMILQAIGRADEIEFDQQRRTGNPARWQADIGRLTSLGYAPAWTLEQGVAELVNLAKATDGR